MSVLSKGQIESAAHLLAPGPWHREGYQPFCEGPGAHPLQVPPLPQVAVLTGESGAREGSSSWLKEPLKALKVWLFCLCLSMVASMTWDRNHRERGPSARSSWRARTSAPLSPRTGPAVTHVPDRPDTGPRPTPHEAGALPQRSRLPRMLPGHSVRICRRGSVSCIGTSPSCLCEFPFPLLAQISIL